MKPLTEASAELLAPLRLASNDRLKLTMIDEHKFKAEIFAVNDVRQGSLTQFLDSAYRYEAKWTANVMGRRTVLTSNLTGLVNLRHAVVKACDKQAGFKSVAAQCDRFLATCTHYAVATPVRTLRQRLASDPAKRFASQAATKDFLGRIPERDELQGSGFCTWALGATDFTASVINSAWPKDQVIADDAAKTTLEFLRLTQMRAELNSERYASFKLEGKTPEHDYDLHPDYKLSKYQQTALVNAMDTEGYGLFMEMGTGKTAVCIARLCNQAKKWREENPDVAFRAIIVCPKNVRMNWESEIQKFTTVCGKITVMRGSALERRKCLIDAFTLDGDEDFTALIVSYDSLINTWDDIKLIDWHLAIGDESHYFKWPQTKRFEYMMKLRDRSRARMPLTGTPITNHALDLYAHFEFMGKGYSGFVNWKAFRRFHAVETSHNGYTRIEGVKNIPFMRERLARNAFDIKLSEALPEMPSKLYDIEEVEMTKRQREIYEQVRTKLAIEIEQDMNRSDRNKSMMIQNVLVKLLRLAQITSGFVVWDPVIDEETGEQAYDRFTEDIEGGNPKIERLLEIAKEKGPNEKTIVWAGFVHDIKNIAAALRAEGEDVVEYYGATSEADREEAVRRFNNDPKCKWFVGNPAAGGTGINLLGYEPGDEDATTTCNHVIYFSQDWSAVKRSQSEARAHRRGVKQSVRITDLCVPGSIDQEIRTRVTSKIVNALEIADVREILTSILGGGCEV